MLGIVQDLGFREKTTWWLQQNGAYKLEFLRVVENHAVKKEDVRSKASGIRILDPASYIE